MTNKQLEIAARKYCELTGLDPEAFVQGPCPTDKSGMVYLVNTQEKTWRSVARRIKDVDLMNQAMQFAIEKQD